ncbi:MAG: BPL-N domain-containing protein [bacterium]
MSFSAPTRRLILASLALLALAPSIQAQGVRSEEHFLAKGTPAQTPYRILRSRAEGPCVLIVGGMHGNEPSGAAAAEQITTWDIKAGTLIIVPRANVLALNANQRRTPGLKGEAGDLNRAFPLQDEVRAGLATDIWSLVTTYEPDWVIDLHEGFDFHRSNSKSVGSSVIHSNHNRARALAKKIIATVDATIDKPGQRFDRIQTQVAGSLARAAFEAKGIPSIIIETTTKLHVLSYRVRQHRLAVFTLLQDLGLGPSPANTLIGPNAPKHSLRVAVFDGSGTGKNSARHMRSIIAADGTCVVRPIGSHDIRAGALDQFQVIVHPGGSGSAQAKALGESGRAAEIQFVRQGGGYLGVCAGAYLAACNYDWSLGLLDAKVIDREHWRRGTGSIPVEWTPLGKKSLSPHSTAAQSLHFEIQYANGPIFLPAQKPHLKDFEPLLIYRGEVTQNGAPSGIMPGTPAIIRSTFGKGRAMAFSPHPEKTEGHHVFLLNSLEWLGGKGN